MAALTITVTQVLPGADAVIDRGIAGATVTAGQVGYLDATTNTYKLFDADLAAANAAAPVVFLNGAASGQPVAVQKGGTITLGAGAAPVAGTVYVAGATAGAINPTADLASTWKVAIIGVGGALNTLKLLCINSGNTV